MPDGENTSSRNKETGECGMSFWLGAAGYPLLELLWRGRTHPAMALAGGLACMALRRISKTDRPIGQLALLGGLMITGIEYGIGKGFNRRYQIWDYRRVPLNLHGQICLPFTLVWCGLSAAAIAGYRWWDLAGQRMRKMLRR